MLAELYNILIHYFIHMKKIFLFALATLVPVMGVLADTPYEKQKERIAAKYYSILKYGYERSLSAEDYMTIAFGGFELAAYNYLLQYPSEAEKLMGRMNAEMEAARSLMIEEDFIKEWEKSDYGKIIMNIKDAHSKKFSKDEFETKDSYYARIKTAAKEEFVRLCIKAFGEMDKSLKITITPNSYDAESQVYSFKVEESYICFDRTFTQKFDTQVKVSSNIARDIKEKVCESSEISDVKWNIVDDKDIYVTEAKIPLGVNDLTFTLKKTFKNMKPLSFEFSKIDSENPNLRTYAWNYTDANALYNLYNAKLQKDLEPYNKRLKDCPYNIKGAVLAFNLDKSFKFDEEKLKNQYSNLKSQLDSKCNAKIEEVKKNLREYAFDEFLAIYNAEHPEMNIKIAEWKELYKCSPTLTDKDYQNAFIDGIEPAPQTCKEKYGYLFEDSEFDTWYAGNDFTSEVEKREAIYDATKDKIQKLNQYKDKINLSFKGIKGTNEANQTLLQVQFIDSKNIKYMPKCYADLLDVYFQLDSKMLKEFQKNGAKFASKEDFFEAYIDINYKQILKTK